MLNLSLFVDVVPVVSQFSSWFWNDICLDINYEPHCLFMCVCVCVGIWSKIIPYSTSYEICGILS